MHATDDQETAPISQLPAQTGEGRDCKQFSPSVECILVYISAICRVYIGVY